MSFISWKLGNVCSIVVVDIMAVDIKLSLVAHLNVLQWMKFYKPLWWKLFVIVVFVVAAVISGFIHVNVSHPPTQKRHHRA